MAKNANLNQFRQLLSRCKVEDDVRAAYSKFFDIPFDASEYIDLYTPQVLFELQDIRHIDFLMRRFADQGE